MRLDGFSPWNGLADRSPRAVVAPPNSEPTRAGQTAPAAPAEPSRNLAPRALSASASSAEYIPARRDSAPPVYGKGAQALASYQATAQLPLDEAADTVFGLDLYA